MGTYSHAVEIPNGMDPPSYDAVHPQTVFIPRPPSPPSTTLISLYSEPIRIEYEENERLQHQAGCGKLLWNYCACCGYFKDLLFEGMTNDTNSSMVWTIFGCLCCIIPLLALLLLFYITFSYFL